MRFGRGFRSKERGFQRSFLKQGAELQRTSRRPSESLFCGLVFFKVPWSADIDQPIDRSLSSGCQMLEAKQQREQYEEQAQSSREAGGGVEMQLQSIRKHRF